jgi:hypothetical protein
LDSEYRPRNVKDWNISSTFCILFLGSSSVRYSLPNVMALSKGSNRCFRSLSSSFCSKHRFAHWERSVGTKILTKSFHHNSITFALNSFIFEEAHGNQKTKRNSSESNQRRQFVRRIDPITESKSQDFFSLV